MYKFMVVFLLILSGISSLIHTVASSHVVFFVVQKLQFLMSLVLLNNSTHNSTLHTSHYGLLSSSTMLEISLA